MTGERHESDIPSQEQRPPVSAVSLGPDDWKILRDLKLQSLEQEPVAFEDPAEGKEKYLNRSEKEWRDILAGHMSGGRTGASVMVFARDEASEQYIGMVTAILPVGQSAEKKTATVQHMYVNNQGYRGKGTGKLLLLTLLDQLRSRGDVQRVELQVVETQTSAIRLYRKLGFKEYGRIPGGAKRESQTFDEIEMALEL